jgi:hypothetical protein
MDKKNVSAAVPCAGSTNPKQATNQKRPRRMTKPATPSTEAVKVELVSGHDFASLEQAQAATLATLPALIAAAVRRGLEAGKFQIIDNRVVICDKIKEEIPA